MRNCIWNKCTGSAHPGNPNYNPYADNCMMCAPQWGKVPACPDCGSGLRVKRGAKTGYCWNHDVTAVVRRRFTLKDEG